MPNHVTNRLVITGPAESIAELAREVQGKEPEDFFSFHRIIPMPQILRGTESGSRAHWGVIALGRPELTRQSMMFGDHFAVPWLIEKNITNAQELKEYLEREKPDHLVEGQKAIEAFEETGAASWYDWALANWETKWDAYSQDLAYEEGSDTAVYTFDTAWSCPLPVLLELAELFPELTISHSYFDEGHNFWGEAEYADGELAWSIESDQASYVRLCKELKGYDPLEDEEEE